MTTYYTNNDSCFDLRNILHRSLISLGCPHVPSLSSSTFLTTTNMNLKIVMWILGEIDPDLAQRLHSSRSFNSIGFLQEFFFESALFSRAFINRLDEIFSNSSVLSPVDLHQLSHLLTNYIHKPILGQNLQLGLIEYLSELLVSIRNPPMIVHHDMWNNREVLNMFEQLPIDETNLVIDRRILEYIDNETPQSTDDEQTSADLHDVLTQVRSELIEQMNTHSNEELNSTITTENFDKNAQIIDKQLQTALIDMHQFFKRLETGSSSSSIIDHSLMSNETLHKLNLINQLNEISNQVQSNDKMFIDKSQQLIGIIDEKQENFSFTLQSQVMLARNLAHTLSNTDQIKKK